MADNVLGRRERRTRLHLLRLTVVLVLAMVLGALAARLAESVRR